jgi:hypothetical protein
MVRRLAGNMYPLRFYPSEGDKPATEANRLTITIKDVNLHNFNCELDPAYDLEPEDNTGKTKLDIDLLQFSGDPTKPVIITINLENNDIEFMPDGLDEVTGDRVRLAVTAGKPDAKEDMRNYSPGLQQDGAPPLKSVSFLCYRTNSGNNKKPHPFNIGLVVKDGAYEMPVILDPKVRNDGG